MTLTREQWRAAAMVLALALFGLLCGWIGRATADKEQNGLFLQLPLKEMITLRLPMDAGDPEPEIPADLESIIKAREKARAER